MHENVEKLSFAYKFLIAGAIVSHILGFNLLSGICAPFDFHKVGYQSTVEFSEIILLKTKFDIRLVV